MQIFFFFGNPLEIIKSIKKNQTCVITKHNYAKIYDQSKKNGIFCVQFMYFKNNKLSKKILTKWRAQCLKWCFNRVEKNKFGDQKYLDQWPKIYKDKVKITDKKGAGIAPWNTTDYKILKKESLYALEKKDNSLHKIFFFHFHDLKIMGKYLYFLGNYKISKQTFKLIYLPYINAYYRRLSQINNKSLYDKFNRDTFLITLIKLLKNFKNLKMNLFK